jgi:hypothetical protein
VPWVAVLLAPQAAVAVAQLPVEVVAVAQLPAAVEAAVAVQTESRTAHRRRPGRWAC